MSYGCYVHIPFCNGEKCPYCGFYSIPYAPYLADDYIPAVLEQARRSSFPDFDTLYIGGGTPSSLTLMQLETLLDGLQKIHPMPKDCEITVELNPENVTEELVNTLERCSVTRVSLGVQSLVQRQLMVLGRKHTVDMITQAFELLRSKSFSTSIDLIFGVPGQELEEWSTTIGRAIELDPDHISIYCLSYEEGTPFAYALRKGLISSVTAEAEQAMFFTALNRFEAAGYEHYEISNLCKPGKYSRHNMKYWTGEGYMGLGAGAHSYAPGPPRWLRMAAVKNVRGFLGRIASAESIWEFVEALDLPKRVAEFLMLRFRLVNGFSVEDVARNLPEIDAIQFVDLLKPLEDSKHIVREGGRLRIPRESLFISDAIILAAVEATDRYIRQTALRLHAVTDDIDMADYITSFHGPEEPSPQK